MNVTGIRHESNGGYDSFLIEALNIAKPTKTGSLEAKTIADKPTSWQKDILIAALDKLENNMQVENKDPLNYMDNPPIENFQEALQELKMLINSDFSKYASQAQANLTPADILYLFEEENSYIV